ncbi:ABC transporter permease subunit [Acuticoccus sp. M5D2P5]|uniref:ABC transporter permease subunit n=1 Tax=Acuticoccus kalidii TaxID=2910977 RepID=UPI001F37DB4A|nr:ABC transporter permease subunit [Acuticoccus kalidii]MCF3936744.1 ABC transporter permease subunit [Acuticoccus kalidii]
MPSSSNAEARAGRGGRRVLNASFVGLLPYVWLLVFFLIPFLIVLKISLSTAFYGQPPYEPVLDLAEGVGATWEKVKTLSLGNYTFLASDSLYVEAYLSSLKIAAIATVLTLLCGFPIAHAMARAPRGWRPLLIALVIMPFWTSFLIRVYAWVGILKREGLLNAVLLELGAIGEPLTILNTNFAVIVGIVYAYLPFMILPLYAALERQDPALLEAASDLGSPPWLAFWQVTVRLSVPGIVAGSLLVFIPAVGEFVIPNLLGGSNTLMIGQTLWNEFFLNHDWPLSSAVAVVLLVILVVPITLFQRYQAREVE